MFIVILISPLFALYHILIHALFKSLLFLLSGSIIHVQYHYQSITKLKINHTLIKAFLLFGGSILILSISKELIIYSSSSIISSLFLALILIVGSIYTIIYTFNLYVICFHYSKSISLFIQSSIYYSFLPTFYALTSIFLDIILEHSLSVNNSMFYKVDHSSLIIYSITPLHFTIPFIAITYFVSLSLASLYFS